jgi:hypothetical protein
MATTHANGSKALARVWDLSLRVIIPALLVWAATVQAAVVLHDKQLAVFEATRFTDEDGRLLLDTIMGRVPPDWLKEDLAEIKVDLSDIKKRMAALEAKIGR